MLDHLAPFWRHLAILCVAPVGAALTGAATAILTAHGVTGVDWPATGLDSLALAGVTLAGGALTMLALYVTPLTRQYGPSKDAD